MQVLGPLLRGHVGLVLLAVEAQQAVLVAEVLHLAAPLHALPQGALRLAAVAPRGLGEVGGDTRQTQGSGASSRLSARPSAMTARCENATSERDRLVR